MSNTKGYVDRSGIYRRIRNVPYHIRQDGYFFTNIRSDDELEFQHYEEILDREQLGDKGEEKRTDN